MKKPSTLCSACAMTNGRLIPGQDKEYEKFEKEGWKFGFGVCRTCGGIGSVFADQEFNVLIEKNNKICVRYSIPGVLDFPLPPILIYQLLLDQKETLARLRFEFIRDSQRGNQFILKVLEEIAPRILEEVKERADRETLRFIKRTENTTPFYSAFLAAYRGDIVKGLSLLQSELHKYTGKRLTAEIWAKMGYFYMVFVREIEQAYKCYKMASVTSTSAVDLVRYMAILKHRRSFADCRVFAMRALACQDVEKLSIVSREFLDKLSKENLS